MAKDLKEQIQIMTHYLNGGQIECKSFGNEEFVSTIVPSWNWCNVDYRIKEQKKTITIEKWLINDGSGNRIIETDNIDDLFSYSIKKVKLLETYEVEL